MKLVVVVGLGCALLSAALVAGPQDKPQLADGPGKAVVERVCGECHDAAERITKLKRSEGEWAELVTDMEGRGMTADAKDLEVVLAYLANQYGPSRSTARRLEGPTPVKLSGRPSRRLAPPEAGPANTVRRHP